MAFADRHRKHVVHLEESPNNVVPCRNLAYAPTTVALFQCSCACRFWACSSNHMRSTTAFKNTGLKRCCR